MREQSGFVKNQLRHVTQIGQGGVLLKLLKAITRGLVTQFGFISEGKQRFFTAGRSTIPSNFQDLLRGQIRCLQLSRYLGKRAVMAHIATQVREGDKHLARIGHGILVTNISQLCRHLHQRGSIAGRCQRQHSFV